MKKFSKFLVSLFLVMLIAFPVFSATDMMPSKNHSGYVGKDGKAWYKAYIDYLYLTGGTGYHFLFTGTPSADRTYTLPDKSGTIAMTSDVSTAAPAVNSVTGANADATIAFTAYQGTFTSTLTNKDMFTFQGLGAFGDVSVMRIEQKTGNATDGTVLEVVSADANVDPLVVSSSGQTGVLTVGQGGTVNIIGATTITGAFTETGAATIGNGTAGVAINSSVWDITAAGAASGLTTLSLTDDISLANGKAIKSSTTTAQTMAVQSYDVDGTAYVNSILLTNGDTPAVVIGSGVETVAVNSTTWDVSTAGAFSGVTGFAFVTGEASTISLASNGAADDLTISVTGANDASLILQSAGTGEDAVKVSSSAGGVDIDALAAKDVNIAGGQVALVSKDDAASAISLTANIGTSETIVVTNTQGTSESAITLVSTAGGVNVDAAAAKDIDLSGGQVLISSKDDAASAIALTANVGTTETIVVTNTKGTGESAITLVSTAGGVNVDAAAAKDLDLAGGQVKLVSKDNAASAISLTANIGTSETITVTNTQGTDAAAIGLTATAGGITAAVAAGKAITLNGTTNLKVGTEVASPAGAELDIADGNYFSVTGTNNITSIAAADSTAGRMIVLKFGAVLTFTDGGNLKLAGNFVTSADDTITLICDGTNWYEMARSVN
jgi:hypothetical protein